MNYFNGKINTAQKYRGKNLAGKIAQIGRSGTKIKYMN